MHPSHHMNGRSHVAVHPLVMAGVPYDDPMSRVLGLDAKTSSIAAWFGFTSAGTLVLVWLMAISLVAAWWRSQHPVVFHDPTAEIEILRDEPPPPPPPPQPTAEAKPDTPSPKVNPHEAPPPPPTPAAAAKILAQEPKPDEPVDLTGNTFITGNADQYAGGFSAGNGTNTNAVHSLPSPTGTPAGTAPPQVAAPPPPGPDRSRSASLSGSSNWSCPFPAEADTAQVDEAFVLLQIDVRADGTPTAVRVLQEPGNGFGREARRCAMNAHYQSALDHDGTPIPGTVKTRVHFSR